MTSVTGKAAATLGRQSYRDIELYAPNRTASRIDLSDNTSQHGMPPSAAATLHAVDASTVTRYPSLYAGDLKQALANYVGVSAGNIVTGCGSDDVLDSAIRAFAEPGDTIAFPSPTFPMIPIFAKMNGLRSIAVPYRSDFAIDVDALIATGARIIYVCSPNNPSGTLASPDALASLIARAPGLVIVDEAYIEYGGESLCHQAATDERVLVTRTLSKAFGLAGLRVGYAVGAPTIVAEVEKSRGPYKVSGPAQRAALAALRDGLEWVQSTVAEDVASRERLFTELQSLGLQPVASQANFLLVPVPDSASLARSMRELGVAVRPFERLPIVGDALRISVGPWELMVECLGALRSALGASR